MCVCKSSKNKYHRQLFHVVSFVPNPHTHIARCCGHMPVLHVNHNAICCCISHSFWSKSSGKFIVQIYIKINRKQGFSVEIPSQSQNQSQLVIDSLVYHALCGILLYNILGICFSMQFQCFVCIASLKFECCNVCATVELYCIVWVFRPLLIQCRPRHFRWPFN